MVSEWVRRLVHVSETSGSRSLEAGGLAAHSLSARSVCTSEDSSRATAVFGSPPSLSLAKGKGKEMRTDCFQFPPELRSLRSLDVLGFPHSVRHGPS